MKKQVRFLSGLLLAVMLLSSCAQNVVPPESGTTPISDGTTSSGTNQTTEKNPTTGTNPSGEESAYFPKALDMSTQKATDSFSLVGLTVDGMEVPLGLDDDAPEFSWQMKSDTRGKSQSAYRLTIAKSEEELAQEKLLWDSGKVKSDLSSLIVYTGPKLQAKNRYFWQVSVWDENDTYATSSATWFETGLMSSGWNDAEWIGVQPEGGEYADLSSFSIETTFRRGDNPDKDKGAFLVFNATDNVNYYGWLVTHSNSSLILQCNQYISGSRNELESVYLTSIPEANDLDETTVKITCSKNRVVTYVNGTKCHTYYSDEDITLGRYGAFVYHGQTAYFKDYRVEDGEGKEIFYTSFDGGNPMENGETSNGELKLSGKVALVREGIKGFDAFVNVESSGSGFAGILLSGASDGNYYAFGYDAAGMKVKTFNMASGQSTTFVDYPCSIPKGTLTISVSTRNGEVVFGVGETALALQLDDLVLGEIGLVADGTAAFSDFRIQNEKGEVLYADSLNSTRAFSNAEMKNGKMTLSGGSAYDRGETALPMYRRDFETKSNPVSARLYISAQGIYEAEINGEKVGDTLLAPGWTVYGTTDIYNTYDVTSYIRAGGNAIGVTVAPGWYSGEVARATQGKPTSFIALLEIIYDDGTKTTIKSDDSWSVFANGPYRMGEIWDGCTYDARYEVNGWSLFGGKFPYASNADIMKNTVANPKGILGAEVGVIEEIPVARVLTPKNGVTVYDFGTNFAGVVRIRVTGRAGQTLTLRFAEKLIGSGGMIDQSNLWDAAQTDTYTFAEDGTVEFTPCFTYHGGQYMELSGVDKAPAASEVMGLAIGNLHLGYGGTFSSSSDLLNGLYRNIQRSMKANLLSIPSDNCQRSERRGWMGDAQDFARTATYIANMLPFYRKYAVDINDCIMKTGSYSGAYASIAPGGATPAIGFGEAGILIPLEMYYQYGDVTTLERYYSNMEKHMKYLEGQSKNYLYTKDYQEYGDWYAITDSGEFTNLNVRGTDLTLYGTAWCAMAADNMAKIAGILGKKAGVTKYTEMFESYRNAWRNAYMEGGKIKAQYATQTSYVLAICFGLLDESEYKTAAAELTSLIAARNYHLSTGLFSTRYLLPALTIVGETDLAYQLLLTETYPSWLYSVKSGATSIWEKWNGGDSRNHYSPGSVYQWMVETAAGIQRDTDVPGYKHFTLAPAVTDKLDSFSVGFDTFYGRIESSWSRSASRITYTFTVPANTTATVILPGDGYTESGKALSESAGIVSAVFDGTSTTMTVGGGTYTFTN